MGRPVRTAGAVRILVGMIRATLFAALLVAALAPLAQAAPGMEIGAAEDLAKTTVFADSKAQLELAASAGLRVLRVTDLWKPGLAAPSPTTLALFRTTARAAALSAVRLVVALYPEQNRKVPLDDAARAEFASYAAALAREVPTLRSFIIGNEPNLNFFWLPQFNPDGTSAAPLAYVQLLAASYDALKAVDAAVQVIGGSLSPAGTDRPSGRRPSHSPGAFILGMGQAYRGLGRALPIMDQFAFHPYGQFSKSPPSAENPNSTRISIADYGKLVSFLGQAFDGTPQAGSTLPLVYDEYGVQSSPPLEKQSLYTEAGSPAAADAVDEGTQALYYRQALQIAFCQPNVKTFLFFHTVDESDLRRWQSGLFYPDLTPKTSFGLVRRSVLESGRGTLSRCSGETEPIELLGLGFPAGRLPAANRDWRISAGCVTQCVYVAELERLLDGVTVLIRSGALAPGAVREIRLPARRVAPGAYRLTIRILSGSSPGDPVLGTSRPLRVG